MVAVTRWHIAQEYERGYWSTVASSIATGVTSQLGWYRWRAERLSARFTHVGLHQLADGRARVIEVGSGPIGVVAFFPGAERVAVDPLEHFYANNAVLAALRTPGVEYRQ